MSETSRHNSGESVISGIQRVGESLMLVGALTALAVLSTLRGESGGDKQESTRGDPEKNGDNAGDKIGDIGTEVVPNPPSGGKNN